MTILLLLSIKEYISNARFYVFKPVLTTNEINNALCKRFVLTWIYLFNIKPWKNIWGSIPGRHITNQKWNNAFFKELPFILIEIYSIKKSLFRLHVGDWNHDLFEKTYTYFLSIRVNTKYKQNCEVWVTTVICKWQTIQ